MMEDKNIDELFREKLLNYEQEPPAYLLVNILDGAAGARRKRIAFFWKVAGVAAALLLAFAAGWQLKYLNHETVDQQVVANQNASPETKSAISAIPEAKKMLTKIQEYNRLASEASEKIKSGKKLLAAVRSSFQEKIASPDTFLSTGIDESGSLHQIKIMPVRIGRNEQNTNELQYKMTGRPISNQQMMAVDRQIVEQNRQMATAQNAARKKGQWSVGAQVSPAFSVSRSNHSAQYASNMLNASSTSPVELGGGISVEYKPLKHWSLQSGVYYAGLGQTSGNSSNLNGKNYALADFGSAKLNTPVNIDALSNKMSMNSTAGVIEFNSIPSGIVLATNLEDKSLATAVMASDARFTQNFQYIEIPLYLRYTLLDSRFDVEMLGGFSSNVLVGNDTYMQSGNSTSRVGKTKDMEAVNYSGTLGLGLKYGLSKRVFLNVEPRIKYYLNSLNSNASVTYKPYTIGVYTGISYQF